MSRTTSPKWTSETNTTRLSHVQRACAPISSLSDRVTGVHVFLEKVAFTPSTLAKKTRAFEYNNEIGTAIQKPSKHGQEYRRQRALSTVYKEAGNDMYVGGF